MTDHAHLARQMECAVIMLSNSLADVGSGSGRYSDEEIRNLGAGLAHVADELQGAGRRIVINASRA